MLSFGVITAKDFVLGNFLSLLFLGDEERPSERFSREFEDAVLSQVLVVLTEHSREEDNDHHPEVRGEVRVQIPEYNEPELSDPTDSVFWWCGV